MANLITTVRIICSMVLLFCPVFSPAFYALYLTAAKFDTVADFVLVVVCLIKLIPVIHMPSWLIIWIIVIAVIKTVNLISGYVMRREMVALHTAMNKVTGILLFVLPLTLTAIDLEYSCAVVCAVATFAAVQEGHLIRTGK